MRKLYFDARTLTYLKAQAAVQERNEVNDWKNSIKPTINFDRSRFLFPLDQWNLFKTFQGFPRYFLGSDSKPTYPKPFICFVEWIGQRYSENNFGKFYKNQWVFTQKEFLYWSILKKKNIEISQKLKIFATAAIPKLITLSKLSLLSIIFYL